MFAVSTFLCVLGLWGVFIARCAGPLFVLALTANLSLRAPGFEALGLSPLARAAQPWFVGEDCLRLLGALTLLELVCHHVGVLRAGLSRFDAWLRGAGAVVAALGLGVAREARVLEELLPREAARAVQAQPWLQGNLEPALIGVVVFLGVLGVGRLRLRVLARLAAQERGDPLGVSWLVTWTEELWTVLWAPTLVLVPPVSVAAFVIGALALLRLRAALRSDDEDDKVICVCGQPNYRTAPRCAGCGGRNASPASVGRLGQALTTFVSDVDAHARALYEVRRCPRCAAPLGTRAPQQFCTACGQSAPPDALFVAEYDRDIRRRTARTLLGTALWGALPLIGLVPGIFHAHRRLIAPYARHVARLPSFVLRALLSLLWLVVIVTQLVPGVGALGLPLMAYASHRAQRAAYLTGTAPSVDDDDWG